MSGSVCDVSYESSQLASAAVKKKLDQYEHASLEIEIPEPDALGRVERSVFSHHESGGEWVALKLFEQWVGGGTHNHLTLRIHAFCGEGFREEALKRMNGEILNHPEDGSVFLVPERFSGRAFKPMAVHLGDFDEDGLQDVMVEFDKGGVIFSQKETDAVEADALVKALAVYFSAVLTAVEKLEFITGFFR